jgi:hypothetical protein
MKTYRNVLIFILAVLSGIGCIGRQTKAADRTAAVAATPAPDQAPAAPRAPVNIVLEKQLTYDQHTLQDEYPYGKTTRQFQWDKIKEHLQRLETEQRNPVHWVTLQNYKNQHGIAPEVNDPMSDEYHHVDDHYGVDRNQSIPLYSPDDLKTPARYGRDGSLFKFIADSGDYVKVCSKNYDGDWLVPEKYVQKLDPALVITKTIFVDKTNQNIATIEKGDGEGKWLIRSMNPATTGAHNPPYQMETPSGTFVIQEKKPKMYYTVDGSSTIAGYAPYASRFTRGGYIHGVPLNNPDATEKDYIEISSTLGTTPRSHLCVRNATSHAKFVYDWAPALKSVVFVME